MMRSDLSTFLPTLGLLGAVLKKIRLRTHKKHQKTQKIYSIDRWHCNCNAGQGYVKRAGLNQYERRAGHPCNLRACCAGWRGWQGTQQQPRGKEASSSKTQECLLTCNRSSQKDGRKLDSKEVKQLTVPCTFVESKDCLYTVT